MQTDQSPSREAVDRVLDAIVDLKGEHEVMVGSFDPAKWSIDVKVSDLVAILALLRTKPQGDADREAQAREEYRVQRIAEVIEENGGCWRACSGCQESDEGYVSTKYYPYDPTFKCQPGSGCSECGGIGVIWEDGEFLASYGDALADATRPVVSEGRALGDLPSRLMGWAGKARNQGRDRIELDLVTVDRLLAALRSQPSQAIPDEPVAWVSPSQFELMGPDPEGPEAGGKYLPVRRTKAGNFTMPLYAAAPKPTAAHEQFAENAKKSARQVRQALLMARSWIRGHSATCSSFVMPECQDGQYLDCDCDYPDRCKVIDDAFAIAGGVQDTAMVGATPVGAGLFREIVDLLDGAESYVSWFLHNQARSAGAKSDVEDLLEQIASALKRAALAQPTPPADESAIKAAMVRAYERADGVKMVEPALWFDEAAADIAAMFGSGNA
jgi:hypothetical protein